MNRTSNTTAIRSIVSAFAVAAAMCVLVGPVTTARAADAKPARTVGNGSGPKHIGPDSVRFQIADFDHSGTVDADDVWAYLAVWSAGKPDADTNGNAVVDFDDLNMFYQIWISVVGETKPGAEKPS